MPFLIAIFAKMGLSQSLSRVLGDLAPIALVVGCVGFLWLRGSHYRDQRDTARAQVQAVEARLAVSNASVTMLQKAIDQQNAVARQKADEYAAAQRLADKRGAELAVQAKSSDAKIARLQALAKATGNCPVNAETRNLAEGL